MTEEAFCRALEQLGWAEPVPDGRLRITAAGSAMLPNVANAAGRPWEGVLPSELHEEAGCGNIPAQEAASITRKTGSRR
ncbi:MAG: hypothetical protein H3C62_10765 [Gemmatimonadaceae bacterium]|nr:hypothetical protein [Gemmatimonadaceae bacterium]